MTSGQGKSDGAEQRRFARVPINLDGLIAIGGRAPVACTVRDFCLGGMFISADPGAYASAAPKTPSILYFALMVDGERQDYQLKLEIARAVAKGMGVSFVNPDPKAITMLGHLAGPAAEPLSDEARDAAAATQGTAARDFAKVIAPLTKLVLEQVNRLIDRFLERIDDVLFLAARDAGNNAEETRCLDGQREMRRRQPRLREEVPRKIEQELAGLGKPASEYETKGGGALGLSDLSLVDKDEFEEFLVVSEMVSELEPQFHEELYALSRRFSRLANRDVSTSGLPVGPGVLCNSISDALKGLQSDRRVITRIYKVLHEVMSGNLGRFYTDVNQLLIEQGILPVIEKDKPPRKQKAAPTGGFEAPGADTHDEVPASGTPEPDMASLMPGPDYYQGRPAPAWPTQPGAVRPGAAPGAAYGAGPAPMPQPYHGAPGMIAPAPPALPPGYGPAAAGAYAAGTVQGVAPAHPQFVPGMAPGAAGGQQFVAPGVTSAPPGLAGMPGPGYAPGTVQAVTPMPPGMATGGAVHAIPPSAPPSAVAAGIAAGQYAQLAAALPSYQVPAGWANASVGYAAPSMQQAYSAAQSQLALRRQLAPDLGPALSDTLRMRGAYSQAQVLDGLSELQQAFASTGSPRLLDVEAVKQSITRALVSDGAPPKLVGDAAADAIEVVAGLFSALLNDALVAGSAKDHLTRLQPSVHKAALLDAEFFDSTDHPVRQLMNRIAQIRDGKGLDHQRRNSRVHELVAQANLQFRDDIGVFRPMVSEMEHLIKEQEQEYERKVGEVIASCEQQQRVLEQRRGSSLEATDGQADRSDLPEEWNKWLERSRRLEVGQRVLMNANSANAGVVTLVWKEAHNNLFVFVDNQGSKASTLTLQQVAMYLRRGTMRTLEHEPDEQPLARAMFDVVDRFHSQLESHATRDALSGFLNRKFFIEAVDEALPAADTAAAKSTALCQVSIENLKSVNDEFGVAAGDGLVKACAETLVKNLRGKDLIFGRLGGAELGVYWPSGGIQGAYKKLQVVIEQLKAVVLTPDPFDDSVEIEMSETGTSEVATVLRSVNAEVVIGVTGSEDGLVQAEGLLAAAREACESARELGSGSIFVSGNESQQRRQLEQMVAYANKAIERDCLLLSGQSITSLTDADLAPALHVAVSARDRTDKPIPAHLFAPALARSEKAAAIDAWVLRRTLAWMVAHEDEVERYAVVVIPLSASSMKNEDLPGEIIGLFMETAVPPGKICFAIPDRDVVENVVEAGELINTLKEFGCRFMLDEFGSGHANYDYIKELAVDFVTVKSSFIADAQKNPKDFAMAKSINELAHFMGKKTIAKQDAGSDLGATMREIGIDFLYDLAEQAQLNP